MSALLPNAHKQRVIFPADSIILDEMEGKNSPPDVVAPLRSQGEDDRVYIVGAPLVSRKIFFFLACFHNFLRGCQWSLWVRCAGAADAESRAASSALSPTEAASSQRPAPTHAGVRFPPSAPSSSKESITADCPC